MHQIELSDQVYEYAKKRAKEEGFQNVNDYIASVVSMDLPQGTETFDHLFTPERLAHIDQVSAEVKAGARTYTLDEVREHLSENRAEWLRKNSR